MSSQILYLSERMDHLKHKLVKITCEYTMFMVIVDILYVVLKMLSHTSSPTVFSINPRMTLSNSFP